jgi:hypothetical protein
MFCNYYNKQWWPQVFFSRESSRPLLFLRSFFPPPSTAMMACGSRVSRSNEMVGEFKKLVIRMNPPRFVSPNPNTDTPHGFDVWFPNLCGCVPSVNRAWFGLAVSPWTVASHRLLLWRPQVILSLSKARSRLTFPVASDRHSCDLGTTFPVVPIPRSMTKFLRRGTRSRSAFPASKGRRKEKGWRKVEKNINKMEKRKKIRRKIKEGNRK